MSFFPLAQRFGAMPGERTQKRAKISRKIAFPGAYFPVCTAILMLYGKYK
jgi:hypothetical protein